MSYSAAFLGLGVMGRSIALNLLKGGVRLKVYNRTAGRAGELLAAGALEADSPAAAADGAQFVFSCLKDGASVEQNLLGGGGAAETLAPGAVCLDFTTIAPIEAASIWQRLKEKGIDFIDAPVSGGDVGARNGTLTIMAGGELEPFKQALPLLRMAGKTIEFIGPAGSGQRMKAANQIAVALNNIGLTEALSIAINGGLDPQQMLRILGSGAAGSWALSNYGPRLLDGRFEPGFFAAHMLKDLKIAEAEGRNAGLELPGVGLSLELYRRLCSLKLDNGSFDSGADLGSHSLIKLYQAVFGAGSADSAGAGPGQAAPASAGDIRKVRE